MKEQIHFLIGIGIEKYIIKNRSTFTVYLLHSSFREVLPASMLGKCNGYFSTNKNKQKKVTRMIEREQQTNQSHGCQVWKVHSLTLADYSSLDQHSVKEAGMLKHLLHVCCYNIKALVFVCKATSVETI